MNHEGFDKAQPNGTKNTKHMFSKKDICALVSLW